MAYIESPCKRACTPTWEFDGQTCEGCGRFDAEVSEWLDMTEEEQLEVLRRIENDS